MGDPSGRGRARHPAGRLDQAYRWPDRVGRRAWTALGAGALGLLALTGTRAEATPLPPPTGAAPCWRAIHRFDELVTGPLDHQLLAIEAHALAEARGWRARAGRACAAGDHRFGLADIEAALERIGVPVGPPLFGAGSLWR